ncbi:hypothetical protein Vi05172_g10423 [Venturia inaequalis]|nr:hypothetical protein Vi05172_g10423 [Venturia inaequalis]
MKFTAVLAFLAFAFVKSILSAFHFMLIFDSTTTIALPTEAIGFPPPTCYNGCPPNRLDGCPPTCN